MSKEDDQYLEDKKEVVRRHLFVFDDLVLQIEDEELLDDGSYACDPVIAEMQSDYLARISGRLANVRGDEDIEPLKQIFDELYNMVAPLSRVDNERYKVPKARVEELKKEWLAAKKVLEAKGF